MASLTISFELPNCRYRFATEDDDPRVIASLLDTWREHAPADQHPMAWPAYCVEHAPDLLGADDDGTVHGGIVCYALMLSAVDPELPARVVDCLEAHEPRSVVPTRTEPWARRSPTELREPADSDRPRAGSGW